MRQPPTHGSLRTLLANLRQPLPLAQTLPALIQNRLRALVLGGCCGHPGAVGC